MFGQHTEDKSSFMFLATSVTIYTYSDNQRCQIRQSVQRSQCYSAIIIFISGITESRGYPGIQTTNWDCLSSLFGSPVNKMCIEFSKTRSRVNQMNQKSKKVQIVNGTFFCTSTKKQSNQQDCELFITCF